MEAPTSQGVDRIVGRETELELLEWFISDAGAWPSAFVIEGSAGIGKSTLLDAAVDAARERSIEVLRCRPGNHESRLSFAGLRDLLENAYDETAGELPGPQRRALAVALLREEPEVPLDQGAVAAAFLTLLRDLSHMRRVLLVVDDAQWLDRPTAAALSFAIRRLRDEPVGILLALRSDGMGRSPGGVDLALSPERLHRVALGPLSLGALQALFRARLGRSWSRPFLRRIHEASDGNPFFALEIARALEGEPVGPDYVLPLPRDLEGLLRKRIDVLPADARLALLIVSASSQPTPDLVASATGMDPATHDALAAAERAGVIDTRTGQVRFTHPLLASTVYAGASTDERRAVHRALADRATDPEERARHLALSSEGPDSSIAAALDEAARLARARGAPDSAAELAVLACTLTPPSDASGVVRRGVEAAGHLFDAGDAIRAQQLLREIASAMPRGPARADVLWRLADASWLEVDLVRGYLHEGLEDASGDLRVESGIRMDLAWTWIYGGDVARATTEARRSLDIAQRLDSRYESSEALAVLGICEFLAGRDGADRIARAVELRDTGSFPETYTSPRVTMGLRALWAGELEAARSILERVLDHLAERGLYTLATEPHQYLAEIDCRAGRYEVAARHASAEIEIKLGAGFEELNALDLYPKALVDALRGDVSSAREYATLGLAWSSAETTSTRTATERCLGSSSCRWGSSPRLGGTSTSWSDSCTRWGYGSPASSRSTPTRSRRRSAWATLTPPPSCWKSSRIKLGRQVAHGRWVPRRDAVAYCSPQAVMPRPRRSCSSDLSSSIAASPNRSNSPAPCSRRGRSSGRRSTGRPPGGPFKRRFASSMSRARPCGPPRLAPSSPVSAAERQPAMN